MIEPRISDVGMSATSAEPTCNLRWHDGVLQQLFKVTKHAHFGTLTGKNVSHEWRPIPNSGGVA